MVNWPDKDTLQAEYEQLGIRGLAQKYSVHRFSVSRALKRIGVKNHACSTRLSRLTYDEYRDELYSLGYKEMAEKYGVTVKRIRTVQCEHGIMALSRARKAGLV